MSDGRVYDGFLPGRYPFDAYGNGGFRFADMSHRGSLLALPSGIRAWLVNAVSELTDEALDPIFAEGDAIDLLLLGTGADIAAIPAAFRTRFREAGIGLERLLGDHEADASGEQSSFEVVDAVTTLIAVVARTRPIVLAIEDLHWADRSSLLLLAALARTSRLIPLLLVGTYRHDEVA